MHHIICTTVFAVIVAPKNQFCLVLNIEPKTLPSALSGTKYYWILYRPVYLGRKSTVQALNGTYIMVVA